MCSSVPLTEGWERRAQEDTVWKTSDMSLQFHPQEKKKGKVDRSVRSCFSRGQHSSSLPCTSLSRCLSADFSHWLSPACLSWLTECTDTGTTTCCLGIKRAMNTRSLICCFGCQWMLDTHAGEAGATAFWPGLSERLWTEISQWKRGLDAWASV